MYVSKTLLQSQDYGHKRYLIYRSILYVYPAISITAPIPLINLYYAPFCRIINAFRLSFNSLQAHV